MRGEGLEGGAPRGGGGTGVEGVWDACTCSPLKQVAEGGMKGGVCKEGIPGVGAMG